MSVIGAIEPNPRKTEIERVKRKRPDSLDAYDLLLRSLPSVYGMMPGGAEAAIPLLMRALQLEPEYASAHAFLAWRLDAARLRTKRSPQCPVARGDVCKQDSQPDPPAHRNDSC
jgi:hypothetical protein